MKRILFFFLAVLGVLLLTACDGYKPNPVGYNYVYKLTPEASQPAIVVPSDTSKSVPHLRSPGLGTTPTTFVAKYGAPLKTSQPPTIYIFQVGLDAFPKGSALVVSFDKGAVDDAPRAVQISFIAGNDHPTTYNQAQAIAEGFFPDDIGTPTTINKQDDGKKNCLTKGYTSDALAATFQAQNFTDASGSTAKPGTIAVSFFPLYLRNSFDGETLGSNGNSVTDMNIVSSVLVTLGTRPYC